MTTTAESYDSALKAHIPTPTLVQSFRLVCDLEPVRPIGEGLHADGGQFNWINFTGGTFVGSWGTGEVVPGGQDSQHILPASHPSSPLCAQLSTRYLVKTHESDGRSPAFIQISTRGWRTGSKEVLQRLSDAARASGPGPDTTQEGKPLLNLPGPEEYKFRIYVEMETDAHDEKYAWLNTAQFVGSGIRLGRQVIYDAYLIE